MSLRGEIASHTTGWFCRLAAVFGERQRARVSERLLADLPPVKTVQTPWGPLRFVCAGETAWWRAEHLLDKEPETLDWIRGFADGDVLWDVGANVGAYALLAGRRSGVRVLAFEPAPAKTQEVRSGHASARSSSLAATRGVDSDGTQE